MKENKGRCQRSMLGNHQWIAEQRLMGAGKIIITKLDIPKCVNCGEEKYVPVVQRTE